MPYIITLPKTGDSERKNLTNIDKTIKIPLCELQGCVLAKHPVYIGTELNHNFIQGLRYWKKGKFNNKGKQLYNSIKENGYKPKHNIVINEDNTIVDGHHRVAICAMLYGPLYQIDVDVKSYSNLFLIIIAFASLPFMIIKWIYIKIKNDILK